MKGTSFYLGGKTTATERQKDLHLNPDDIAAGTLFTVGQKPVLFLQPH